MPRRELDRHHRQAKLGVRWGVPANSEKAVKASEDLERRCRHEKIRRAMDRR